MKRKKFKKLLAKVNTTHVQVGKNGYGAGAVIQIYGSVDPEPKFRLRNTAKNKKNRSHLIVVAAEKELDGGDHDLGDLAEAGRSDDVHGLLVPPHVLLQHTGSQLLRNRNWIRKSHKSKMFLFYNFTKVTEGPVLTSERYL